LPEAADEVTAGVDPGLAPVATTNIWNAGAPVGAGAHWNAHPMSHVPPAIVNAGLVQFPVCCVDGTSTVAGPTATVVDGDEAAPPATVVVVDAELAADDPAAVVVGAD
jgi:hypothetical protein